MAYAMSNFRIIYLLCIDKIGKPSYEVRTVIFLLHLLLINFTLFCLECQFK